MIHRELNPKNYRRICIINWMLAIPFFIIFSWPYVYISSFAGVEKFMAYSGCILFSIPFMITILHGHVTMALGEAHRHHYYDWLNEHLLTYGLLFHPVVTSTRFRLVLLCSSFLVFVAGYLLRL
ncbi:MAG TPA: hypothetical protein VF181_06995 [Balneolaceae bacterium]